MPQDVGVGLGPDLGGRDEPGEIAGGLVREAVQPREAPDHRTKSQRFEESRR